jgi:hypothetical protein
MHGHMNVKFLLTFFICVEVNAWNSFLMCAEHKLVAVTI